MSDADPASRTNELGVVDPIRVPGLDTARRLWNGIALLGRVFIVAAAIDLVVRLSGLLDLPNYLDFGLPLGILSALPHYALIVLPAVVLARRQDATTATPLLVRGAIGIALVELLRGPLGILVSPAFEGAMTGWMVLQLGIAVASAGAYLALALGLKSLDASVPSRTVAGLGNLVAGLIAGNAVLGIVLQLTQPPIDFGLPEWNSQVVIAGIGAQLAVLPFAYLARTIIRGATDARRPRIATTLAAGAMVLSGIDALFLLVVGVVFLLQTAFPGVIPQLLGGFGLGVLGSGFVMALVVVAFGLGLGDTSVRMPRTSNSEESPA